MHRDENYTILMIKRGSRETFVRIFSRSEWMLLNEIQGTEDVPYQMLWSMYSDDEATPVIYMQDHILNLHYFLIKGEEVQEMTEHVRTLLGTYLYTEAEIFALWSNAKTDKAKIAALYHVGAAAPAGCLERFVQVFAEAFIDSAAEVRRAAVWAAAYLPWQEIQHLVRQANEQDGDADVREEAGILIRSYAQSAAIRGTSLGKQ